MPKALIKIAVIGLLSGLLFVVLLLYGTGESFRQTAESGSAVNTSRITVDFVDRDTWMNVYQNDRKIGYTHSVLRKLPTAGYNVAQDLYMRLNVMGMLRSITIHSEGTLNPDFSLSAFSASISSGVFQFEARGSVRDQIISVTTRSEGSEKRLEIPINGKLYFSAGITDALGISGLEAGSQVAGKVFDPAAMSAVPFQARMIGPETINVDGSLYPSKKISLQYKGVTQYAWLSDKGEVLKEEGFLGIILERTTREEALFGKPLVPADDITLAASVPVRHPIETPEKHSRLRVRITGIPLNNLDLDGGRQRLSGDLLTITKEDLGTIKSLKGQNESTNDLVRFLAPSPFIQSDHPRIEKLVTHIITPGASPLAKVKALMAWMAENIEKRPVLSMPDAISTLNNKEGDCNEHAMLLAAMARAAGIPAKIEAGLVYLDGRFFYHAWNLLYVGHWLTVDAALNQMPADVTHIRFISDSTGDPIDLLPVIGKIGIEIMEND